MQATVNSMASSEFHFALCESCFWCATVINFKQQHVCPSCSGSVSLIPLARDEQYRIEFGSSAGLEMSFSKRK